MLDDREMFDRAAVIAAAVAVASCGGSPPPPVEPPLAASASPTSETAPEAPDAGATRADSGPAASGELIGEKIQEPSPAAGDPKSAGTEAQLAAAVLMKSGHKECLKLARVKQKPDWKPVHYEVVLTLKADGAVFKVEADKSKTDVSDPGFVPCVLEKLKTGKYPAPGREVSARLIYPD